MAGDGSVAYPEFGAHLPLIDLEGVGWSLAELVDFARSADGLGYTFLCANDHLVFTRPWLDGPTALAAVIEASGEMTLATTVALPVVRGPVQLAKTLAAIDIISGGRLVVGVGPGSSGRDYEAVGLGFEERWRRLDEAILFLRALWRGDSEGFSGLFYATGETVLEPRPVQQPGPPIWVGSWGAEAGLRRVARLGDGWLASGYNITPERFRDRRLHLSGLVEAERKLADRFPNALATVWTYVTEDRSQEERILRDVLSPLVGRPVEVLQELFLPIGPAEACAERLTAFARAGVQRMFLWPLADPLGQLECFQEQVAPLIRESITA
jgi:alkanesulfonate monooxygenase SsuD/methylene tetrahydromethanopterin reductase-like flavin-dependent oxidoreductase (luciferase family)